jgi:subtilisin family serine protease
MKRSDLSLAILLSIGLTACGGGGGGDPGLPSTMPPPPSGTPSPAPQPGPAPYDACINLDGIQQTVPKGYVASGGYCTLVDACLNYAGNQTLDELADKGFVRDEATGDCHLERNHRALSTTGVDVVRMAGYTGGNVGVAILDTGYLPNHSEYVQSVVSVVRYLDSDGDGIPNKIDGDYYADGAWHGTPVTSQACGVKSGVATRCGLYLKVAAFYDSYIVAAAKDAILADGVPIINSSNGLGSDAMIYWSATSGYDPEGLMGVLSNSASVYVNAAGNEAQSLSDAFDSAKAQSPEYDSCLDHPQEAENVLFVGAYDLSKKDLALYSNYPGHRKAFQDRFLVTGDYMFEAASENGPDAFKEVSGTSLAAPQASGALAVLMAANPRLTAPQAAQILLDTAQRPAFLGYGKTCTEKTDLGTFETDCGAMKFGRGLMDLPKAVEVAKASG